MRKVYEEAAMVPDFSGLTQSLSVYRMPPHTTGNGTPTLDEYRAAANYHFAMEAHCYVTTGHEGRVDQNWHRKNGLRYEDVIRRKQWSPQALRAQREAARLTSSRA
jgi:hypothetical protein